MLFDGISKRRQQLPTQANPLLGLFGASTQSKTGLDVDEEKVLESTGVWSAITQLSQTIASLPLHLYKRLNPEGKDKYTQSPLYNIMHLEPNSEMSSMAYREAQMGQVLCLGTCFSEIERDGTNKIKGLWPLLTCNMETFRNEKTGDLYYKYRLPNGEPKFFSKDRILRINGFSHSGLLGYSPVTKNIEAIGLSLALEEYAARFFGDGAKPPVVLEHPQKLSQEASDRLRKAWNELHRGLSNSQRVAILEEGMSLKPFGVSPEDSQAIESRSFQITEIARIFNMPPHMLKDLTRATYSNIEEQSLEFVIYSLRPWLVRFEQAYSIQLLDEKARKKYFFEHNIEGLLRGNIQTRYAAYSTALGNGWINADEVREKENLNPQPNGQGKKYYVPLNWIPKEDAGKNLQMPQKPPPAKEKEEESEEIKGWWLNQSQQRSMAGRERIINQYYPLFKQAAQTIVNYESNRVKKAIIKSRKQRAGIKESLEEIYRDVPQYIKDKLGPVIRSFSEAIQAESAAEMDVEVGISAELQKFIENYIDRYAERHADSSLGQLISLLEEETEAIEQRVDEWHETRADKIAGDETVRNSSAVYQYMAFVVGFTVVWRVQSNKPCPFCSELNGQTVAKGGHFVKDGDELNPEGVDTPMKIYGSKAHPPLHQGCKCALSII